MLVLLVAAGLVFAGFALYIRACKVPPSSGGWVFVAIIALFAGSVLSIFVSAPLVAFTGSPERHDLVAVDGRYLAADSSAVFVAGPGPGEVVRVELDDHAAFLRDAGTPYLTWIQSPLPWWIVFQPDAWGRRGPLLPQDVTVHLPFGI